MFVGNANAPSAVYSYVYDSLGNITNVFIYGILIESYEYDSLGQLIRENNVFEDYTKLYEYDKAGNIRYTSIMPYKSTSSANIAFAEGAILPYGYSTSEWGDLLTSYGGTSISYDAIGNPTNWRNASNLTWKARELQSLTVTGGPSVAFEYNSDGIRTQKTVGGSIIHDYVLDGTKIIRETVTGGGNNYTLYYLYDTSGSVQGFIYNNSYYYFQKNLQGDVVRILNSSGTVVVEYTYDAWGKVLSVTGSLASTIGQYNPFRYRSYYYDTETGFYYLQSRYYDPTVGRFLNADGIIGANGGIVGYNLFAYCNNNPIVFSDESGFALRPNTKVINDGSSASENISENETIIYFFYNETEVIKVGAYEIEVTYLYQTDGSKILNASISACRILSAPLMSWAQIVDEDVRIVDSFNTVDGALEMKFLIQTVFSTGLDFKALQHFPWFEIDIINYEFTLTHRFSPEMRN